MWSMQNNTIYTVNVLYLAWAIFGWCRFPQKTANKIHSQMLYDYSLHDDSAVLTFTCDSPNKIELLYFRPLLIYTILTFFKIGLSLVNNQWNSNAVF